MRFIKSLWLFITDSIEALVEDDRDRIRRQQPDDNAAKLKWQAFLYPRPP